MCDIFGFRWRILMIFLPFQSEMFSAHTYLVWNLHLTLITLPHYLQNNSALNINISYAFQFNEAGHTEQVAVSE